MKFATCLRTPFVFQIVAASCAWLGSACLSSGVEEIRTVAEIRRLPPEVAETGVPVRLRGVVTFSKPSVSILFVHDGTGGIFVAADSIQEVGGPKASDEIEVLGITGKGHFANIVLPRPDERSYLKVLGPGTLPKAREIDGLTLFQPGMDCEWVEIKTYVKDISMVNGRLLLSCQSDGQDYHVLLEGEHSPDLIPWDLAGSQISVRGTVATAFNTRRQMIGRFVMISSLKDVTRKQREPAPENEPPLVGSDVLLQVDGSGPDQLVRVHGTATVVLPGRGFYMKADDGSLWVQTTQSFSVGPGTIIEVTGWPRPGEVKPFIRARHVKVLAVTAPPKPLHMKAADAMKAEYDGAWVSVEATLLNSYHNPEGWILELLDGNFVFRGECPDDPSGNLLDLRPGSKIRIAGVVRIGTAGKLGIRVEDKLTLIAPTFANVELIAPPPYWTAGKVTVASSGVFLILLGAIFIARTRRKRELATQRREFEAVLNERGRFAREIHDSLAQGLTSVSLQLECARTHLSKDTIVVSEHLEKARSLVRESLREARRTVWNLRPLSLGEADLASTLQRYAANLSGDGRIKMSQQIEGTPRPLPPDHEATLLRIGQEALTNAVRHSGATEVIHRLCFGNGWITLTVSDNGCGFDVAERVGKRFGLTGIHERMAASGGSLSIDSIRGQGTEVSATLSTQ